MSSPIRKLAALSAAPYANAHEHMLAELEWLKLVLHRQVKRMRAGGLLVENDFRGLYVPDDHVDAILNNAEAAASKQILEGRNELDERIEASSSLPLTRLRDSLHLTPFETRALVACAAPEVDLAFEALFAYVQNDVNRKRPTADLMLKMFAGPPLARLENRACFSAESALVDLGLIRAVDLSDAHSSLAKGYRTDDRITDHLLGVQEIDSRLRSFAAISTHKVDLSDLLLPAALKQDIANAATLLRGSGATLVLSGPDGSGKRSTAQALSNLSGRPLLMADMAGALTSPLPLPELLRLLRREAMLQDADLFLGNCHHLLAEKGRIALVENLLVENLMPCPNLIVLGTETPLANQSSAHLTLSFQLPPLPCEHRRQLWEKAISETGGPCPDLDLRTLSGKFDLTGGQIYSACWSGALRARLSKSSLTIARLEAAVREQSGNGLRRLAQKIETKQRWADLVLPSRAMQQLHAVAASHSYRDVVYSDWGFGQKLALGKGLNVLFFGPSGAGKTMAASILANELGLDLYKIDLSSVVSKYIGETEKHLSQIFLEAHTSNAILLFDEADALFGKRSEVKDAHDKHANVETAYLLQKMEEYEGIVILTTNFRKNLDDAFARRMHHAVEFPLPDAANRQRIWTGLVPSDARFDSSVNFAFLARQFELSGGNIRNAMVSAAFLAAEESSPIRMEHLLLAAARELLKLGRLPSKSDFREYFDLIQAQL